MNAVILSFFLAAIVASVTAESGSISVYNSGGFVAKFVVEYTLNGQRKSENAEDFPLGVTESVTVPDGATNVYLKVENYWFPGSLNTIFTKTFDSPVSKCYKLWGTTLNPSSAEIAC